MITEMMRASKKMKLRRRNIKHLSIGYLGSQEIQQHGVTRCSMRRNNNCRSKQECFTKFPRGRTDQLMRQCTGSSKQPKTIIMLKKNNGIQLESRVILTGKVVKRKREGRCIGVCVALMFNATYLASNEASSGRNSFQSQQPFLGGTLP